MKEKKNGSALVFSLLVLSMILVAALGVASVSVVEKKSSLTTEKSTQAFQVADSGIEWVLKNIKISNGTTLSALGDSCNLGVVTKSIAGGTTELSFYDSNDKQIIDCGKAIVNADVVKSTASFEGTVRAVQSPANVPLTPGDFDLDGKSDLVWMDSADSSRSVVWPLDQSWSWKNNTFVDIVDQSETTLRPGLDWKIMGTGDFNGDGKEDILWHNTNVEDRTDGRCRTTVWLMDGIVNGKLKLKSSSCLTDQSDNNLDVIGSSGVDVWRVGAVADLDADGKPDIIWKKKTGGSNDVAIWYMNGTKRTNNKTLTSGTGDEEWRIVGAGDFDGDKIPDILWRCNHLATAVCPQDSNDTERSGSDMLVWYMKKDMEIKSTSNLDKSLNTGNSWTFGGLGDFDSDYKSDFLWRNSVDSRDIIWLMNDTTPKGGGTHLISPTPGLNWKFGGGEFNYQ